jgi:ubiquinone/menaquinone biosynthesis C-methylase UbiE
MFPDLELVCADAEELPFRNNEFDVVTSVEVIEHLPNIDKHLIEVKRVLKKGGLYMIKTPNKLIELIYNFIYRKKWDPLHFNSQNLSSLKKLLINHGFKPTFYSMGKLAPSRIRKINNLNIRLMFEHLPINNIPKLLQPSLTCVAKVVEK